MDGVILRDEVRAEEARTTESEAEISAMRAENAELRREALALRAEVAVMKDIIDSEKVGAALPPEEAATVTAAIEGVLAPSPPTTPQSSVATNTQGDERAKQLEAMHVAKVAALLAAKMGKSPNEIHEAAEAARERVVRAYAEECSITEGLRARGATQVALSAASKAAIVAMKKEGGSRAAAESAAAAAELAVRAGARQSEALIAGRAAAEMVDDLGSKASAVAGKAALEAVRVAYSVEHSLTASEAVARITDRFADDGEMIEATRHAAAMAANGKPWHAIVEELKRLDLTPQEEPIKPTVTSKFVIAATSEAKRAGFGSTEGLAAAEAVAAKVFELGCSTAEAAIAGKVAARARGNGVSYKGAILAGTAAAAILGELQGSTMSEQLESTPIGHALRLPASIERENTKANMALCMEAADVAGEETAVFYSRGKLRYEALRAGAAAAAMVLKHPEAIGNQDPSLVEAAAAHATRAAHDCGSLEASDVAAEAAVSAIESGMSPLAVEAAAAAAMQYIKAHAHDDDANVQPRGHAASKDTQMAALSAARAAAQGAQDIIRAVDRVATASGTPAEEAEDDVRAAIEAGANVAETTAITVGKTTEEASAALMACRDAEADGGVHLDEHVDSHLDMLVAAAMVAAEQTGAGATISMAARAGKSAAASVANGATLNEAQEAARHTIPEIPGWSLESWLGSLKFDKLVSDAILKRVREAMPAGQSIRAYEQAFVVKLGEHASVETILCLLKETPVLRRIAEAICAQAEDLVRELEEARIAAEETARRRAEEELANAEKLKEREEELRKHKSARRKWTRVNLHRNELKGGSGRMSLAGSVMDAAMASAAKLNEEFVKQGAFTLSYSTDASLYWAGLSRITGAPGDQTQRPLIEAMEEEHCAEADSRELFQVGNYNTITTSEIEWYFVTRPADGLELLEITEWPGTEREIDRKSHREALPDNHFRGAWDHIDRKLLAVGEQPLSVPEFYSLRLYTGPLYKKYNAVLRSGAADNKMLRAFFQELCLGNRYPTTIHVLTAAIIKLGKIVPADKVYRAPGGALPKSFWCKDPQAGMQGGLELAFMSTTTAKDEAMEYARRSSGMVLFEIQQGFVARGASIAWLSQYPDEEEILFPPLTALEVCGTRVEGAVLIVELRPSMKAPESVKSGTRDVEEMARIRSESQRVVQEARMRAEADRQRAADAIAATNRQKFWQQSMAEVRVAASRRLVASAQLKLAEQTHDLMAKDFVSATTEAQKQTLKEQLEEQMRTIAQLRHISEVAEQKAEEAKLRELKALTAKQEAEAKVRVASKKARSMLTEAQFMRGVLRAKAAALLYLQQQQQQQQAEEPPPPTEEEPEETLDEPQPEEASECIDHGEITDEMKPEQIVLRFKDVVGTQETWPIVGVRVEDIKFLTQCLERLSALCATSKKARKAAARSGIFEHIGSCMKRYESEPLLLFRCCEALAAIAKKADTDQIQEESQACMYPLVECVDSLMKPALATIKCVTRNNRENTLKLLRAGGKTDWLDAESNVVVPQEME